MCKSRGSPGGWSGLELTDTLGFKPLRLSHSMLSPLDLFFADFEPPLDLFLVDFETLQILTSFESQNEVTLGFFLKMAIWKPFRFTLSWGGEIIIYQAFCSLRHYNLMKTGSFLTRKLNQPTSCLMLQFKSKNTLKSPFNSSFQ